MSCSPLKEPTFWRNMLPPSSWLRNKPAKQFDIKQVARRSKMSVDAQLTAILSHPDAVE
jgi:hypothetical protein